MCCEAKACTGSLAHVHAFGAAGLIHATITLCHRHHKCTTRMAWHKALPCFKMVQQHEQQWTVYITWCKCITPDPLFIQQATRSSSSSRMKDVCYIKCAGSARALSCAVKLLVRTCISRKTLLQSVASMSIHLVRILDTHQQQPQVLHHTIRLLGPLQEQQLQLQTGNMYQVSSQSGAKAQSLYQS